MSKQRNDEFNYIPENFGKNLVPTTQKSFLDGNGIFQLDIATCHTLKKMHKFF